MRVILLLLLSFTLVGCPDDGRLDPGDDDDTVPSSNDDDSAPADDDDDDSAPADDDDDDDSTPDPCAEPPPPDLCLGICQGYDPVCIDEVWGCGNTPGYEPEEVSCDGFDNDCDGEVDEGSICPDCDYSIPDIEANLHAMWDLDFDFSCNTYLTTLISGPDYTTVVPHAPALDPPVTYYGNANQNMGFALVDPDPSNDRVVVTYQCCPSCGCQATNGLTLLYTCEPDDPGCGCAGQANCPGFLDAPFLPTGLLDTTFPFNGWNVSTPNGLAVGPRNSYYVGNFRPETCTDEPGCIDCDPSNPGVVCTTDQPNCCDDGVLGRLAQFTLPGPTGVATWRIVGLFEGEEILGLAAGRDTTVLVGTKVSAAEGRLYRYDPITETATLLATYPGPVYSITQARWTGDWYLAVDAVPEIVRLAEDATTVLPLPASIPADPPNMGVLQWAPDGQLYRLIGYGDAVGTLEVYPLD